MSERDSSRFSAHTLVVAIFGLFGLRLGLNRLADNSAFTHLATGIRMVEHGLVPVVPKTDPYTFTAHGRPWVVQSWLAEAGVGWAYRLFGQHGVTIVSGLCVGACAAVLAVLARTSRPLRTVAAAAPALLVSFPEWTGRPLMVGLLALGLTVLVVERRWSPWWLVPVVWVWVNSHGSFPLGGLWIVLVIIGSWIDRRRHGTPSVPLRYAWAFGAGFALSAVNPVGPKLLVFPLTILEKKANFAQVVEWRSPNFQTPGGVVALVGIGVSVFLLARAKLSWRDALPVAVFAVLGLEALRNLAPLGFVLAPALARALERDDDTVRAPLAPAFLRVATAVVCAMGVVFAVGALQQPLVDASSYPAAQVRWLEQHHRFDAPHRVAEDDTVGNYIELVRGPRAEVFVDDRVDMFPLGVIQDEEAMLAGLDRGINSLDRWHVDTVVWKSHSAFAQRLTASGRWTSVDRRGGYVVLVRRMD